MTAYNLVAPSSQSSAQRSFCVEGCLFAQAAVVAHQGWVDPKHLAAPPVFVCSKLQQLQRAFHWFPALASKDFPAHQVSFFQARRCAWPAQSVTTPKALAAWLGAPWGGRWLGVDIHQPRPSSSRDMCPSMSSVFESSSVGGCMYGMA